MRLQNRTDIYKLDSSVERLVALGDPHGDTLALKRVFELEDKPGTAFISVGDNVGYKSGEESSELVKMLMESNIPSVWGNHEHWMEEEGILFLVREGSPRITEEARLFCKSLPRKIKIESELTPELSIFVQHSIFDTKTGDWDWINESNVAKFAKVVGGDIIITGHSHSAGLHLIPRGEPISESIRLWPAESRSLEIRSGNRYVVDSGSISRADGQYPNFSRGSYSIVNFKNKTVEVKHFDKVAKITGEGQIKEEQNAKQPGN